MTHGRQVIRMEGEDQDLISTNTANLGILSMIIKHSSLNNDMRKLVVGGNG